MSGRNVRRLVRAAVCAAACAALLLVMGVICSESARAQQMSPAYRTELGINAAYQTNLGPDRYMADHELYRLDATHNFRDLRHNLQYSTEASRIVLPKSWVRSEVMYGPLERNGPEPFLFSGSGAALLLPSLGLGGRVVYSRSTHTRSVLTWSDQDYTVENVSEAYTVGVHAEIHASPAVYLREYVGFGASESRNTSAFFGNSSSHVRILQYEHSLAVTGGGGFAYLHELRVQSDGVEMHDLTFNNYAEIAPEESFCAIPQLGVNAKFTQIFDPMYFLSVGVGFRFQFSPLVFLQLTPVYSFNVEHPEVDWITAAARFGVRF